MGCLFTLDAVLGSNDNVMMIVNKYIIITRCVCQYLCWQLVYLFWSFSLLGAFFSLSLWLYFWRCNSDHKGSFGCWLPQYYCYSIIYCVPLLVEKTCFSNIFIDMKVYLTHVEWFLCKRTVFENTFLHLNFCFSLAQRVF